MSNPTNLATIPVTINFGEAVTGFSLANLIGTNATPSNFSDLGGGFYTFDVTPATDGMVTVSLDPTGIADLAGNPAESAIDLNFTYDATAPSPSFSSVAGPFVNGAPFTAALDFGEVVTGFSLTSLTATNGSLSNLQDLGSGLYQFDVTPTTQGPVSVDLNPAGVADNAGNTAETTSSLVVFYDTTAPSPVITYLGLDPTNQGPLNFTINFGEMVSGMSFSKFIITNGTGVSYTDYNSGSYDVTIIPDGDGLVTVGLDPTGITDLAGNATNVASPASANFDTTSSSPMITGVGDATNQATVTLTISFGEAVTGFTAAGLLVLNGTVSNLADQGNGVFTFDVTALAEGLVSLDMDTSGINDLAGNSIPPTRLTYNYDATAPSPTLSSVVNPITNATTIPVTINFGKVVTGVSLGNIAVTNGVASNLQDLGDGLFTFDVTPDGEGACRLTSTRPGWPTWPATPRPEPSRSGSRSTPRSRAPCSPPRPPGTPTSRRSPCRSPSARR